ncbi:anthranilate synthase subunit II [Pontibacillus halophilus JSM 076056 = DSM 19796]|uniref:Anthranilate synthase subunit II n=1 Tax=Pontibacillus halophilus JSM 076056 = DSM 19796 TaxID=1385510 RepID=A0A0A5GJJ4_9BACI|nr:aminodeoxychorismate/anthranilate synthase component II [Pontibacillus halophilus]KGX91325.1 anthranilate synthase subunit II [Pontibacillus halophilus JSM 076056 = DSM 19796]
MIVMIDNYDSFTYNLYQYLSLLNVDECVRVVRNDEITVQELEELRPSAIILSPGPGRPSQSGICQAALEHFKGTVPILGICLGHQLIIETFGGQVHKGKRPMHGKVTNILHDGETVFQDIPTPTKVTRYHSLVGNVSTLPDCLMVTARDEEGVIMGIRHHHDAIEGIQFHPESILTEHGLQMLQNFFQTYVWTEETRGGLEHAKQS